MILGGIQSANVFSRYYPTGQNYSLKFMFAKFATAKNPEKIKPLTFSSPGAICLKTTLGKYVTVKECTLTGIQTSGLQDWLQVRRFSTEL